MTSSAADQPWRWEIATAYRERLLAAATDDAAIREVRAMLDYTREHELVMMYGDIAPETATLEAQEMIAAIERQRSWDEHARILAAANDKSIELLKKWLSPKQLEQYERDGTFDVIGGTTGRRYRINHPAPFSISQLDKNGNLEAHICIEPAGLQTDGDKMLAQKIALEKGEINALAVANTRSAYTGGIFENVINQIATVLAEPFIYPGV